MRKVIDVLRREGPDACSYHQRFSFETTDDQATVATALTELQERPGLVDIDGNPATPVAWESSCLQRRCGACAMVICGVPRLACETRLGTLKGEVVTVAPLTKFPVVRDLIVDRQALFQGLLEAKTFLGMEADVRDRRWAVTLEASRCLACGLCLEVCPNFSVDNAFGGMAQMVPLARLLAASSAPERKRLAESYRATVHAGCAKSLACHTVCPAGIDIDHLMSRSNAAAVWGRW